MQTANYTTTQRFEALAFFFGWQGGTVHQLEAETGCDDILNRDITINRQLDGFSAVRTCEREHRTNILAPKNRNNWEFWSGVIHGYWITGALGGIEFSKRFGN